MLPLARAELSEEVVATEGQTSGGSGGSGFKAGKLITRLVFGVHLLWLSLLSVSVPRRVKPGRDKILTVFLLNREAVTQRFPPDNKQSPLWKERTQEFILRPFRLVFRPTMLYF